ncbi:DUF6668 family protein [Streptomyces daghestanicus]|uniref:Uncharacterized protein n=1 Tax=Streptomyces daghestanicus TaxID=66885 RepID=A0ABQ3Q2Y7_9ACTN|nr:DUF6668 family protein [Streptomyces daghestanicus]GGU51453.1 hypothetical protein GCM10010259_48580 [Streptomyces daghestanicus]GHI31614.1 hypothetical protein Sdagh_33440 [Streptomyces daghestanicus]
MRTSMHQGPEIWLRGPVSASGATAGAPPGVSWVGTHGGAGVTTLAEVYGGQDCGRDWPGPAGPARVALVARTHAAGLAAAGRALDAFRHGEAPPGLGLDSVVLVADAPGRLPRPLARQVRLLEAAVAVHRVPWVAAWRLGDLDGPPPRGTGALARLAGADR